MTKLTVTKPNSMQGTGDTNIKENKKVTVETNTTIHSFTV